MNGPQHYAEAERLIALNDEVTATINQAIQGGSACGVFDSTKAAMQIADGLLVAAQVHATLALVAATANLSMPSWCEAVR